MFVKTTEYPNTSTYTALFLNTVGVKLERKKVSPAILERVKLFNAALNLDYDEDDEFEGETHEEYLERKAKEPLKPNRMKVVEGFKQEFKVSLDYHAEDIVEVSLFKAAMMQDQKKFTDLLSCESLDPTVKTHVLSYSVEIACRFRDIETVKFLVKNEVNLIQLSSFDCTGLEYFPSSIAAVVLGYCKYGFIDKELIDLLFENGLDLNDKRWLNTRYFDLIDCSPEEFAIEMLGFVKDVNQVQYITIDDGDNVKTTTRTYLNEALIEGKFKLSKALIERGADVNMKTTTSNYSVLDEAASEFSFLNHDPRDILDFVLFLINGGYINFSESNEHFYSLSKCFGVAVKLKNMGLVELILKKESSKDFLSCILIEAIGNHDIDAVKIIVSRDIDINHVVDQSLMVIVVNRHFYVSSKIFPLEKAVIGGKIEICRILIDAGADVNFKSEVHGGDIWSRASHKYEIAKIIVASGKLDLTGRDEHEVKKYNQIKAKMAFEKKVLADVEALKAAHAGVDSKTISESFIPKKQVDAMLKYYLKGYKAKFAEEIKSGDAKFFDDLAGQVVKSLNEYIKFSWHQLHDISKGLEVLVSTGEGDAEGEYLQAVPKGVIGLIGEYVVFNDTQEIVD